MNMYQVVELPSKTVVATGFVKREDAKPSRDTFNTGERVLGKGSTYIVGRGSDHPCGPSFGPVNEDKRWL